MSILILVTCTSCKTADAYKVKDYLNYLAIKSGIDESGELDSYFNSLLNWKIVQDDDKNYLEYELNNAFVYKTISNLLDGQIDNLEIENNNKKVNKQTAEDLVDKAVYIINNKTYESNFEYSYKTEIKTYEDDLNIGDLIYDEHLNTYKVVTKVNDNGYEYKDATFEEVFSNFEISDSYELDFTNAEVIPYFEDEDSSYVNNKYNLLANKTHVFSTDGFRVSYKINSSGIDVHVSKKVDKVNIYTDASINNIKPTFKWTYKDGDIKNCYFDLKMNSTVELGASFGKYGNYYLKFKDLDSSSFLNCLKSMVVPKNDEVEAIIPICTIKTPIPNVPMATVNLEVGIKLYVSGKAEIVFYNSHNIGFEIKEGNARFFYDHNDDIDTIASASAKAAVAVNLGLDAATFRLCDIELDGGVKSEVKATLHLYDSDFNETEVETDVQYSTLQDISKENSSVKVCGDVSLYWLLDLICNTHKSILYKYGFSKTFHILDDDNQVFGNLHHIEDGQFVKKCTRKTKTAIVNQQLNINSSNKIVLNSYAEVLSVNETFNIEVLGLPSDYNIKNIKYSSSDSKVAKVKDGTISAIKPGNAKIDVYTSDNKYHSYINILVSTG